MMTTLYPQVVSCIICGAENDFIHLASTNSFGSPDLDFRFAGMVRYTLNYDVQTCYKCGFSAPVISSAFKEFLHDKIEEQKEELNWIKQLLDSKEYKHILNKEFFPEFSNSFLADSYIQEKIGNYNAAFHLAMKSAWIADDNENILTAMYSRKKALELLDNVTDEFIDHKTRLLLKIELLRRTEQFEEANKLIEAALEELKTNDQVKQIINFQSELIHKKDNAVHRHDEVMAV